jgi:hypothetical protein
MPFNVPPGSGSAWIRIHFQRWIRILIRLKNWIRILIKSIRIRNTGYQYVGKFLVFGTA